MTTHIELIIIFGSFPHDWTLCYAPFTTIRAVWHQADPITKGTRWALVIFYDVQTNEAPTKDIEVSQLK